MPASVTEVDEKRKWFDHPICKELLKKGIKFGFEIKGPIKGLNINCPFGVHLPNNLVNYWRDLSQRKAQEEILKEVVWQKNKPLYVVTHGIKVSQSRKGYEPTSKEEEKYIGDVGASEYLQAAEELVEFIKHCQGLGLPIVLENTAFTNFSMENGNWLPETYIDLRIGTLSSDMKEIQRQTGCELITDIEHLGFALNFADRRGQYNKLPNNLPAVLSKEEKLVWKEFGIFCRAGEVPIINGREKFSDEVKAIDAKIYHVAGCYHGKLQEIKDGRIVSHSPILAKDKCFRQYLKTILGNNPEIIVIEVGKRQKQSFFNFCKYLLELL